MSRISSFDLAEPERGQRRKEGGLGCEGGKEGAEGTQGGKEAEKPAAKRRTNMRRSSSCFGSSLSIFLSFSLARLPAGLLSFLLG